MTRQFLPGKLTMFFLIINIVIISCNSNSSTDPDTSNPGDSPIIKTTIGSDSQTLSAKTVSGVLDTLWMESSQFLTLSGRLTFRFYIGNLDTLTLHGWSGPPQQYDNRPPNVKLEKGKSSKKLSFGPGCYLGNLLLEPNDVARIRFLLTHGEGSGSRYVLFGPLNPMENKGQVTYEIFLSNDDPHALNGGIASKAIVPTTIRTNPSPPARSL